MHENGTVSIVGRKKDMIVRGGENIYPTEVEQYLFRHPMIEDVQVCLFTYIFAVYFLSCCHRDSFICFISFDDIALSRINIYSLYEIAP